jgi:hypothetical protein
MLRPKGVIILKSDQRGALACENAELTHAGRFGEKEAGGSTPAKTMAPKSPTDGTLQSRAKKKSTLMGSTSNQPIADQPADDKKKGATDKEVLVDPDDTDKKLRLSTELDAK